MKNVNVKKMAERVQQACVGSSLRQLNRVVSNIFNSELAAVGMTNSQFNILTALLRMQSASPAQIAKILHLEKSSLSRNLEVMRRNGWLQTEGNSRIIALSISSKGKKLYTQAFPHWERAQAMGQKIVGKEVAENLRAVLQSLKAA